MEKKFIAFDSIFSIENNVITLNGGTWNTGQKAGSSFEVKSIEMAYTNCGTEKSPVWKPYGLHYLPL